MVLSGLVVVAVIAILLPTPFDALWLGLVIVACVIGLRAWSRHEREPVMLKRRFAHVADQTPEQQ